MNIVDLITSAVHRFLQDKGVDESAVPALVISPTRKEFSGDYTLVVFPLSKALRSNPVQIAGEIGEYLLGAHPAFSDFNVVKGFLNISLGDEAWKLLLTDAQARDLEAAATTGKKVVVEYSSPNTNKPIHLGHMRNILLGWSVSNILEAAGHKVHRTQIINDRGIAICKSMLAWQLFADGETPESTGTKGDHFVGKYYVRFNEALAEEYSAWQQTEEAGFVFGGQEDITDRESFFKGFQNEYFNRYSILGRQSREMLRKWEERDEEVVALWKKMNDWVYDGFWETFGALGVSFDSVYYESETFILGKKFVLEGLEKGIFYREEDGSVWADLEPYGLDRKILLRSDGTSVYMTQDLGTAHQRYLDTGMDAMIYTVGNEQEYHFKALFAILDMLGEPYAGDLHHLSYGMVELPSGKMKSREGTVVDADDLLREVIQLARENAEERGELSMLSTEGQEEIIRKIAMAALKFHILKVDARKRMLFDPAESVDLQGQTGPYIQNAFVRIRSIMRKREELIEEGFDAYTQIKPEEKTLLVMLAGYEDELRMAAESYNPSGIANYAYALARAFHRFYHDHPVLKAPEEGAVAFRLALAGEVARTLEKCMNLLGIGMPDRM